MKVFLTGATGFIGGEVARRLRERGDEVVALVRNPARAGGLAALGVDLVQGDLGDEYLMRGAIDGAEAVVHAAAMYEMGIPASRRQEMYDANVTGTERVLGAALELATPKVLHVSSVVAFGDTRGKVVDETHEHDRSYRSYYEETKHLAHLAARDLADKGLPLVTVLPGAAYGPRDHSQLGNLARQFLRGRLPLVTFGGHGLSFVHRDDVAAGILLALDAGVPGEPYVLGGETSTLRGFLDALARVTGRRPPVGELPARVIRAVAWAGPVVGPALGYPPNFGELVESSDGVTYWASSEKAKRDLGYAYRSLEHGLKDTVAAGV